ncbi:hypothetical protein FDK38_003318 [Candidozyma auris]|nr:hypothetical protein FDK38_003318 [[Candida] auris]
MVTRNPKRASSDPLSKPIVSTVSNPIPTKELVNRLAALAEHLSCLDQGTVDPKKYASVARDLANTKLLNHQNEAIKAHTCCCISDILRIYAPEAPYSEEELSKIFRAFFDQLGNARDINDSYHPRHSYLLTRLVEVRSIILVVDLPEAGDLITLLFERMYDLAAKGFPHKLESLAADMLAAVISEAESIPKKVVSTIFKSLTFTGTSLTGESSNISHPGYTFSKAICEANIDKMSRQVAQLFSEMLDESAKSSGGSTSFTNASFKTLETIHTWSIQIWRHVPEMLGSIIGLIGDELTSDSEKVRVMATNTIGQILATSQEDTAHVSIDSNVVHFVSTHKDAWLGWLKKASDVSPSVRSTWISSVPGILNSPSITSEMSNELRIHIKKSLVDSSEKVRSAACTAIDLLPFLTFTSKLLDEEVLRTLFSLCRERDENSRNKVIRALCYVYDNYIHMKQENEVADFGNLQLSESRKVEEMILREFPNQFLQLNYINLPSITTTVDVELFENALPFQNDASKRVLRVCQFYSVLDQKSKEAFTAIILRQQRYAHALSKFVELSQQYHSSGFDEGDKENIDSAKGNKPTKDDSLKKVEKIISWFASHIPQNFNAHACLETLFMLNNGRHATLLRNCISPRSDYKTVKNSIKEFILNLSNQKSFKTKSVKLLVTSAEMISTIKILVYRASPIFFNRTNIAELISIAKNSDNDFSEISNELLETFAQVNPQAFEDHIEIMADMLMNDDFYHPKNGVETLLRSMYYSIKKSPSLFPDSLIFTDRLLRLAKEGSPVQAKYAVKLLGCHHHKESFLADIVSSSVPLDPEDRGFSTKLSSIAEVCLIQPILVEQHVSKINSLITEQILKKNRHKENSSLKVLWIEKKELEINHKAYQQLLEKLLAIRYIVNRIRSLCLSEDIASDPGLIKQFEKPIKLLALIVARGGEIVKQTSDSIPTPVLYQQHLRLAAGLAILKLGQVSILHPLLNHDIMGKIGRLMYDQSKVVRETFMKKLQSYLSRAKIPEKFAYLVFFMGHEPDSSLQQSASTWIKSTYQRLEGKKDMTFERALARLIHGIAHNERFLDHISTEDETADFTGILRGLEFASKFIMMYLTAISKDENISFLYYIASRVKQYRDATISSSSYEDANTPSEAVNLYRVAELCQLLIKEHADQMKYTLQTWPGKLKLPTDIFSPMENFEEASKIIGRQYISDDIQLELRRALKKTSARLSIQPSSASLSTPTRKRKATVKAKKSKSKVRIVKEANGNLSSKKQLRRSSRARKAVRYDFSDDSGDDGGDSYESLSTGEE